VADVFREEGIDVRTGVAVEKVASGVVLSLSDGTTVEAERLLVATGRRPNVEELGLEHVGVSIGEHGIDVDERCRAAENVWAIGDVSGVALFTHVGKYQARVAAADLSGRAVKADYRAIPAGIFTDPEVATVGSTEGVSARWELTATPRLSTYERPKRDGFVRLFADPVERVLVGAVAVGPQATEWLGQLTLAVRSATPIEILLDTIQPYPTFSEAIFLCLRELDDALGSA
jgi:pyruvate/2-oxoglutarate dehydrogenase complex dihydrolipoamide dehydrogenase (E3) component